MVSIVEIKAKTPDLAEAVSMIHQQEQKKDFTIKCGLLIALIWHQRID